MVNSSKYEAAQVTLREDSENSSWFEEFKPQSKRNNLL